MTNETRPAAARPRPDGPKKRPDARPMRLAFGVTGMAAFAAMATAMISPAPSAGGASAATAAAGINGGSTDRGAVAAAQAIVHVKRTIVLQPGQTPPPAAIVTQLPAPSPRVVTIVTTQSGTVIKP
jgi:hypothetical protein